MIGHAPDWARWLANEPKELGLYCVCDVRWDSALDRCPADNIQDAAGPVPRSRHVQDLAGGGRVVTCYCGTPIDVVEHLVATWTATASNVRFDFVVCPTCGVTVGVNIADLRCVCGGDWDILFNSCTDVHTAGGVWFTVVQHARAALRAFSARSRRMKLTRN